MKPNDEELFGTSNFHVEDDDHPQVALHQEDLDSTPRAKKLKKKPLISVEISDGLFSKKGINFLFHFLDDRFILIRFIYFLLIHLLLEIPSFESAMENFEKQNSDDVLRELMQIDAAPAEEMASEEDDAPVPEESTEITLSATAKKARKGPQVKLAKASRSSMR